MLRPEVIHMTKSMINKTWIAGLVVFAAGLVAAMAGVFLMLAYGGTFTQVAGTSSYDFVPRIDGFFWSTVSAIVAGGVLAAVGGLIQLAAWIGGLVNSFMLPEKTWFFVLLIGGVLSLAFGLVGFAVMVAYVIAAPDGTLYRKPQVPATLQKPTAIAPAS
jgi:hypothetical protein